MNTTGMGRALSFGFVYLYVCIYIYIYECICTWGDGGSCPLRPIFMSYEARLLRMQALTIGSRFPTNLCMWIYASVLFVAILLHRNQRNQGCHQHTNFIKPFTELPFQPDDILFHRIHIPTQRPRSPLILASSFSLDFYAKPLPSSRPCELFSSFNSDKATGSCFILLTRLLWSTDNWGNRTLCWWNCGVRAVTLGRGPDAAIELGIIKPPGFAPLNLNFFLELDLKPSKNFGGLSNFWIASECEAISLAMTLPVTCLLCSRAFFMIFSGIGCVIVARRRD